MLMVELTKYEMTYGIRIKNGISKLVY